MLDVIRIYKCPICNEYVIASMGRFVHYSYKNEIYVAENHCGSEILVHPKEIDTTYPKIVFSVKGHEGDLLKKMSTMILDEICKVYPKYNDAETVKQIVYDKMNEQYEVFFKKYNKEIIEIISEYTDRMPKKLVSMPMPSGATWQGTMCM